MTSSILKRITVPFEILRKALRKKEEERPREVEEAVRTVIPLIEPIQVTPRDPSWRVIESYYVYKPFVKVTIAETPEGPVYYVEEYGLTMEDKAVLDKLTQILMDEIRPPERPEEIKDLRSYVFEEAKRIAEKYRNKLGLVGTRRLKLLYYIERNLIGYGPIDPLMRDPNIEDISCNGVNIPIYIWHRKYENIPTNITFLDDEYLNEYVMKLAHMAGKHISIAFPIVDAMLPGKHRLAATFGREISVKGPTFTIRKFRERPFSPVELIMGGTLNSIMAAYLWTLIEHGKTALIAGGTGTGKSFPGDTKIIVRINGKPAVVEASKLYNMIDSREYTVGDHIVKDIDNHLIEVLSVNDNYKLSWRRLIRIIKHRDHRPLVRVRTNTSIITTTLDHNFIKIDPHTLDLVAVEAKDLKPGDYIVNTWLDIEYNGSSTISTEYAYFLGLWSGDGNLDIYNKSIVLTTSNEDIIRKYKDLVKKLFGKNVHIVIDKRNNVKSLRFYHEQLYRYLLRLFNGNKSYTIRVPNEILFSSDKSVLLSYIAGILDSDGSIYVRRHRDKMELIVEFTSRSRELINGISFMLKRLRIQHVIKVRNVRGKPAYRILIYGMEALKLLTLVKDYVSIQINDVIEIANKYYLHRRRNPNYMVYPISEYLVRIREALGIGKKTVEKELGLSSRYMRQYEYCRRKPGIDTLKKLYMYYSNKLRERPSKEAEALLRKLAMLMDGDVFFEKIISIEKIEPTNEYLYDLEVEDTHNFVIGQIGWRLNHNTTLLNAISLFIKPGMKIVSVEDTPELNLPHTNWVQLTSRESYVVGMGAGTEVKLFDLVKLSLRYRPDYIIVGEVRGEEAFVLFQAMASVSYDTPVLIRDSMGKTYFVKIGEFIDKFYREGEERIAKNVNGYYVLSHDGFRVVWKPIKYVLRHSVNEIYEIEYEGGGKLEATGSHSVFVLDPDTLDIIEKPVSLLNKSEYVISFKGVKENTEYQVIDLIELVKDYNNVYVDNIPNELKKFTEGKNPISLQQYIVLRKTIETTDDTSRIRLQRSKYTLPLKLLLDEELAFLFGAYIAGGYIKEHKGKRVCFTLGKSGKAIANKVVNIMYKKFGIKPIINDRSTYSIYEYPHTLLAIVFEKLLGRKLEEKKIPIALWISPKSVIRAFFEGLKAGSRRTLGRRYTRYSTANRELAFQLLWLARYAGFYSELVEEKGTGKNTGKTYYNVMVYLNQVYRKPNASERIPVKPILKLIEYTKPRSMPPELTYIKRREFISRKTAQKVLEWIKRNGSFTNFSRKYLGKIETLINGDIILLKIKDVRKKTYHGYVYDISVPETESFFGGNIPILLHNTGHGGLSTLHAETLDYAIKRLTSPPMNIPKTYMKLMNVFIHINRVITRIEKGIVRVQRRISILQEVEDYDKYITIAEWDPRTDEHKVYLERSIHLRDIAAKRGLDLEDIIEEIYRKATVLNWMIYRNVTNVWDVSRIIFNYYYEPETIYKRAVEELHKAGEEIAPEVIEQPTPPTIATSTASLSITETEKLISRTEIREDITRELFGRTRELRRR